IVFWAGGKIRRVNVATRESAVIPIHVRARKKIHQALRFPVDVAPASFDVRMPRWAQISPDGTKSLFQALGHLYVAEPPGGEPKRLTASEDGFEFYPSFSRDGKWVVYTTWDDDALGTVRIVPASGGASRSLTPSPGLFVEPRFSTDGQWVVYRRTAGGYILSGIGSIEPGRYVVPVQGGDPRR